MESKPQETIKNSLYNTAGTFIYFFLQWVTTVLVVRLSGYQDAGVFSLVVSFTNIFCFISKYGMMNYQVSDVEKQYTSGQYLGARCISSLAALAGFLIALTMCGFSGYTILCSIVYMLFKFMESFTEFFFALFQGRNEYRNIALSYTQKGVLPLIGFALGLYFKDLFTAILLMEALYFAVLIFYDLRKLNKGEKIGCSFRGIRGILMQCTPLMLSTLITPYMTFIVRYVINDLYGEELLGYYSTISMVVVVMTTLAGSVWVVLLPQISRSYLEKEYKKLGIFLIKIVLAVAVLGVFAVLAGMLLGPWAFGLLFGKEILDYMYLLTPVLIASVLLTLSAFFSAILIPLQKRTPMLLANLVGALSCTACAYPFAKADGMMGANNSLIIGLVVQLVLLGGITAMTLMKKEESKHGKSKSI